MTVVVCLPSGSENVEPTDFKTCFSLVAASRRERTKKEQELLREAKEEEWQRKHGKRKSTTLGRANNSSLKAISESEETEVQQPKGQRSEVKAQDSSGNGAQQAGVGKDKQRGSEEVKAESGSGDADSKDGEDVDGCGQVPHNNKTVQFKREPEVFVGEGGVTEGGKEGRP